MTEGDDLSDADAFRACLRRNWMSRCPMCGRPAIGIELSAPHMEPRLLAMVHVTRDAEPVEIRPGELRRCVVGEVCGPRIVWGHWGEA